MAEFAVFNLLAKFTPFLLGQVNLLSGVWEEIEFIKDEFERIKAFLSVADSMEENDPELKVWVKQVREAAYDTADALDKYRLHLGHDQHGLGKVFCFIKTLKARYQIASEVQRIKSKVISISDGYRRYKDRYPLIQGTSRSTISNNSTGWYDSRGDALLLKEAELVGIDEPKMTLIEWLQEEHPQLQVISITGMGGLGKTTLARKVYDNEELKGHFQSHAWITVSESFNIEKLLKRMIKELFEEVKQPVPQEVENMDATSLKAKINAFLQHKRYLLVFDDVWDIQSWQYFRHVFPDDNFGSRVIVTTRNVDLATFSSREYHGNVYDLKPLSSQESWTLFCRKTFQGNPCPSHLEGLSRGILRRCEGLPLAVVSISGLLSIKDTSNVDEWERIHRSLGTELEGNDQLLNMNKILSLSYIDLPYHLKLCFLYLSIFPEDYDCDHWRLIRLWVAEGFAELKEGMTAEEVVEGYLHELISRSLIQVANTRKDGRAKAYRIHDLWREIIVSRSREQNIVTIANNKGCITNWPEKVRRLSIHNHLEDIQQRRYFTRLRSLFMFSTAADSLSNFSKVASLGDSLKLLTTLDLSGTLLETFPNEVSNLLHLTYLSLRETKVKIIPKSIGKLKNLETLDLKRTHVTELPDEILRLQRLRHLLLYRYNKDIFHPPFQLVFGFKAPVKIGSLSSLQKLCSIEANHAGNNVCTLLGEIGKLTQLRRLHILKLRREDGRFLCSSLEKLSHLRSLVVRATEEDEIIDLDSLSLAPQLLRSLYLEGRLEKLPLWIPSLHSLTRLSLSWSKLSYVVDPLQPLQDLPNLIALRLYKAYEGEELCFKASGFQRLKVLRLVSLKRLRLVTVEAGSMRYLEKLIITNCELLEELPSSVEHLSNLKDLQLIEMSDGLISSLKEGENYRKIAHIPIVWIGDNKNGYPKGYYLK